MCRRSCKAPVTTVLLSLGTHANAQQNRPDERAPPPVYVLQRDGLSRPALPRSQPPPKEAATDTPKPPAPPVAREHEELPKALMVSGEYRLAMLATRDGRGGGKGFGEQLNRVRLKVDARATPLWRLSSALLTNPRDRSRMFYPSVAYSISDNLSVLTGGQFFSGGADTDFGGTGDMLFVRVQYYF